MDYVNPRTHRCLAGSLLLFYFNQNALKLLLSIRHVSGRLN